MRLALLIALFSLNSYAYTVITDLDDTIKISNSESTWETTWNGLFTDDVFAGMPELFHAWTADGAKTHIVTASPTIIKSRVEALLKKYKIEYASLTMKKNLLQSKFQYKLEAIEKIISASDDQVILMGDDAGQDREVFAELEKRHPTQVMAIYVRPIQNRGFFQGQVPYLTTFDILITEYRERRLSLSAVTRITTALLASKDELIIPKFGWCPTELDGTGLPTDEAPFNTGILVEQRVESICRGRRSGF